MPESCNMGFAFFYQNFEKFTLFKKKRKKINR